MKIINTLLVTTFLSGAALAGDRDGSFYVIDLSKPNGITYVQRQGDRYYYSSKSDPLAEVQGERRSYRKSQMARDLDQRFGSGFGD